jgi:very-long-chain (3R)-3-hydroxyacyl-CoA dehydratase
LILWSIADINRYLYYIFKNNSITGFLRYNGFLVLYPLGGVAEMIVINNYIARHPDLNEIYIYIIRAIQAMILAGIVILYSHMLKARKKYMKGLNE